MQRHIAATAFDDLAVHVGLGAVHVDGVARRPADQHGRALRGRVLVERVDVEIRVAPQARAGAAQRLEERSRASRARRGGPRRRPVSPPRSGSKTSNGARMPQEASTTHWRTDARAGSGPRVGLGVRGADVVRRDARVDLGGAQVGVAEHGLDGAEVGSAAQEMCGERVPQLVRGGQGTDAGRRRVAPEMPPEGLARVGPPRGDTKRAVSSPDFGDARAATSRR